MPKLSAGILLYRWREKTLELFLVHPGGPFWKHKDAGAWSIPKGEYLEDEDPLSAARREFAEETGFELEAQEFKPLGEIKEAAGKVVAAWAVEGQCSPEEIRSNLFSIEWPPRSGKIQEFPEVDRAGWFSLDEAREKLLPGQREFLDRLMRLTNSIETEV